MKFYGPIGYRIPVEIRPSVYQDQIIERFYPGDVLKFTKRDQSSNAGINDNIEVSNRISIVSDPFAYQHFFQIKYVTWMGVRWKVTDVDASNYPRLVLSIGGVYNGETAAT